MTLTYDDGSYLIFEIRNLGSYKEAGVQTTGNTFFGADGYYVQGTGFFDYKGQSIPVPADAELPPSKGQHGNFLQAVRSRKESDIHGTALNGHLSSGHCHIGNTAHRLGRSLEFDPAKEKFVDAPDADALITRNYRAPFVVPKIT